VAQGPGGGVYNIVSGLAGAAISSGRARDATSEARSIPDSLVQDRMRGASSGEKSSIISAERERLSSILKALESEQQSIDLAYGSNSGLKGKSKSEQSFERVDDGGPADSNAQSRSPRQGDRRSTSGGWMSAGVSSWLGGGDSQADNRSSKGWSAARDITEAMSQGTSSGYERDR
jgi:hypothetical protein